LMAALLGFFLLSLIGIPFTGGFFGKFYAFSSAVHGGHVWLAVVGLINSGVACYYYLRLLVAMYARPVTEVEDAARSYRVTVPAGLALAATAIATLALGVMPNNILHMVRRATPTTLPTMTAAPVAGPSTASLDGAGR
jgi:NADH-quinone oxidoreductase subunit N